MPITTALPVISAATLHSTSALILNKAKSHNLRQTQHIDYNGLNGSSLADSTQFTLPKQSASLHHNQITANNNKRSTQPGCSSMASLSSTNNMNSASVSQQLSSSNNVPIINSDNHYERQYTCKRCGFFTNNPRAVLYHRKEFHFEKINIHECTYCQYASQYSGKVERHTLLRHKIDINHAPSSKKLMSQKLKAEKTQIDNSATTLNLIDLANQSHTSDTDARALARLAAINNSRAVIRVGGGAAAVARVVDHDTNKITTSAFSQKSIIPNDLSNLAKFQCNKCPCKVNYLITRHWYS